MTTTFKLLLASLLLAAGTGLAQAAKSPPAPIGIESAAMPSAAPVAQTTSRLAWQRVGSPVREV